MKFYEKLSSIGFLRNSYVFKFLFVAFIGIHIPLIGILFFVLYNKTNFSTTSLLFFSLVMTLIATVVTLVVLKKLIHPIELASKALKEYKSSRKITSLPLNYADEAGLLLTNIHDSIQKSEKFITEKQDLIYLLSHDLKTFAGNPKSLATMILETNPSDEVKELAEMICQSSSEQFQYIEKFIKMLKEQDEMLNANLEFKIIALDEIVESIENQVNQAVISKKIKLIKNVETTAVPLKIDQELLTRVIYNLVYNAIKFSLPDSEIYLKVYSDKKKTYIEVIDQGIGFEQHENEKMFAKFTTMSRLGTNNEGSTGIGLYLSRQIIERHDGMLISNSEGVNKGAVFTIIFLET